jgi:hypothetical protein
LTAKSSKNSWITNDFGKARRKAVKVMESREREKEREEEDEMDWIGMKSIK